eukprot:6874954-Pyramimonas_sp.AAC.1
MAVLLRGRGRFCGRSITAIRLGRLLRQRAARAVAAVRRAAVARGVLVTPGVDRAAFDWRMLGLPRKTAGRVATALEIIVPQ